MLKKKSQVRFNIPKIPSQTSINTESSAISSIPEEPIQKIEPYRKSEIIRNIDLKKLIQNNQNQISEPHSTLQDYVQDLRPLLEEINNQMDLSYQGVEFLRSNKLKQIDKRIEKLEIRKQNFDQIVLEEGNLNEENDYVKQLIKFSDYLQKKDQQQLQEHQKHTELNKKLKNHIEKQRKKALKLQEETKAIQLKIKTYNDHLESQKQKKIQQHKMSQTFNISSIKKQESLNSTQVKKDKRSIRSYSAFSLKRTMLSTRLNTQEKTQITHKKPFQNNNFLMTTERKKTFFSSNSDSKQAFLKTNRLFNVQDFLNTDSKAQNSQNQSYYNNKFVTECDDLVSQKLNFSPDKLTITQEVNSNDQKKEFQELKKQIQEKKKENKQIYHQIINNTNNFTLKKKFVSSCFNLINKKVVSIHSMSDTKGFYNTLYFDMMKTQQMSPLKTLQNNNKNRQIKTADSNKKRQFRSTSLQQHIRKPLNQQQQVQKKNYVNLNLAQEANKAHSSNNSNNISMAISSESSQNNVLQNQFIRTHSRQMNKRQQSSERSNEPLCFEVFNEFSTGQIISLLNMKNLSIDDIIQSWILKSKLINTIQKNINQLSKNI